MRKEKRIATTVKLERYLYDEFKVAAIRDKHRLTLQHFVESCVHLYVSESAFRETVTNFFSEESSLSTSGSFKLSI